MRTTVRINKTTKQNGDFEMKKRKSKPKKIDLKIMCECGHEEYVYKCVHRTSIGSVCMSCYLKLIAKEMQKYNKRLGDNHR